jgi:hypothetical protein
MKKLFIILMAALFVLPMTSVSTQLEAQNPFAKELEKQRKKQYKSKIKEYKKEAWKIFGSTKSVDVALLEHYNELFEKGDQVYELVGIAAKFKSKEVGRQMALNSASYTYAQSAKSFVQGRVTTELGGDGVNAQQEFDKFYAAYERLVSSEIKGELKESYAIIRDLKDGTFEMQVYYIVDQDRAAKIRESAMAQALKESQMAQEHAEKVSNFIREGFNEYQ